MDLQISHILNFISEHLPLRGMFIYFNLVQFMNNSYF